MQIYNESLIDNRQSTKQKVYSFQNNRFIYIHTYIHTYTQKLIDRVQNNSFLTTTTKQQQNNETDTSNKNDTSNETDTSSTKSEHQHINNKLNNKLNIDQDQKNITSLLNMTGLTLLVMFSN